MCCIPPPMISSPLPMAHNVRVLDVSGGSNMSPNTDF